MLAKVTSCAVLGLEGNIVEVEIDCSKGLPNFTLVGLPDAAVKESSERVRSAMRNSGLRFPGNRVTVNLAPADLKKVGPSYDLPMALGLLIGSEQMSDTLLHETVVIGELALDGSLRHVRGILPMTAFVRSKGYKRMIVPACDAAEAALVPDIEVIGANDLAEIVAALNGIAPLSAVKTHVFEVSYEPISGISTLVDFKDVKGQEIAKRALELAAAGGHNCLFKGSPGAGKTMLARAMPGILPALTIEEALEVTRIYSVADMLPPDTPMSSIRPFRAPHHTISHAGLIGGGKIPRPGEVSLAHRGVLFLDELPEFDARALEVLRQPMEDKLVTISRASGSLTFPANFQLIAAMNPCKCGWFGDPVKPCTCSPAQISQYQKRISGPLLDRIDIHLEVQRLNFDKLSDVRQSESSETIRQRVQFARDKQAHRFKDSAIKCNADMGVGEIRQFCALDDAGRNLMKAAMQQMQLSARAFHRVLKLARTIADLANNNDIKTSHLAEALQYRPKLT
jgi:magnesium chelatase family protein